MKHNTLNKVWFDNTAALEFIYEPFENEVEDRAMPKRNRRPFHKKSYDYTKNLKSDRNRNIYREQKCASQKS